MRTILLAVMVFLGAGGNSLAETFSYILIDNDRMERSQDFLDQIRLSLSPDALHQMAGQGHFDATPRLMVKFKGSCDASEPIVREVTDAVKQLQGNIAVSCSSTLP